MPSLQRSQVQSAKRPVPPAVVVRPLPSERRSREQRAVRDHQRLVAQWLRSLSAR